MKNINHRYIYFLIRPRPLLPVPLNLDTTDIEFVCLSLLFI